MEGITFRRYGEADYTGMYWFRVYENNTPVMLNGVHLEFHALSEEHCMRMWRQRERIAIKNLPTMM